MQEKAKSINAATSSLKALIGRGLIDRLRLVRHPDNTALLEATLLNLSSEIHPLEAADTVEDSLHRDGCTVFSEIQVAREDNTLFRSLESKISQGQYLLTRVNVPEISGVSKEQFTIRLCALYPQLIFRVNDIGLDPINSDEAIWVLVQKRLPIALLFLGDSFIGKTATSVFLAERLSAVVVHGDECLSMMSAGLRPCSQALQDAFRHSEGDADWSHVVSTLFSPSTFTDFLDSIEEIDGKDTLIFDMRVPREFRTQAMLQFAGRGYFPVLQSPVQYS